METFSRIVSSKGWSYFWITWSVIWVVVDVLTGSFVFAALMAVMALYFYWDLRRKNNGTHPVYNQYHGEKV